MPWWRNSFRACSDCAHLPITSRTCSPAERWFVIVTPSILMEVTRRTFDIRGGRPSACLRLQFVNMISEDLALLSLRLLFCTHPSTWSSCADLELALAAGITIYVSSAYLNIKFPALISTNFQKLIKRRVVSCENCHTANSSNSLGVVHK